MVSPPATSEAGAHAAGDTKREHFEPARVRKLNEKQFKFCRCHTCTMCHGTVTIVNSFLLVSDTITIFDLLT
jgi:hypothetical protein